MVKTDDIEAISQEWCQWLVSREVLNPRRITLTVWASYNVDTTEEILDKVWETYIQHLRRTE